MLKNPKQESVELDNLEKLLVSIKDTKVMHETVQVVRKQIQNVTNILLELEPCKSALASADRKLQKQAVMATKKAKDAERDLEERKKANIARFKELLTCNVDGEDCDWNEKVTYRYEGHGDTENIKATPEDLCENILDNLVSEPDSRSDRKAFDRSIFERFRECGYSKFVAGKKGGHVFKIVLYWRS